MRCESAPHVDETGTFVRRHHIFVFGLIAARYMVLLLCGNEYFM
jgi:hypothetical protein